MPQARFTQGSTMRHILLMSLSGAVGITALFVVDMLDMFFLSLLGEKHLAAAVGYAGTILFITTSLGIGLSIASAALVSRAVGQRNNALAGRYMVNISVLSLLVATVCAVGFWFCMPSLLEMIGARGEVHELAMDYLRILVPSVPVLALSMNFGAGLRSVGDARLSMLSTLAGGAVNAVFDPIFIFGLDMGIEGAALASVLARFTILGVSAWGIIARHRLFGRFSTTQFYADLGTILKIALPAIATNLAMPVSNSFITRIMAQYGDGYVAGYAVVGRIIPVAFGIIFALSGAIGPIVGQNYGAKLIGRVRQSLKDAYLFTAVYVLAVSVVLFLLQDALVGMFNAQGNAASMIRFFCTFYAVSFIFNGWLFVSNASFNNLGKPGFSTLLNWGKATLGTIPFVWLGAHYGGAYGVLTGQAIGGVIFALVSMALASRLVNKMEQHQEETAARSQEAPLPCTLNPLSSECTQMGVLAEEAECEEQAVLESEPAAEPQVLSR
ncbi:MATE family efflux transporter [Endozoicomonadaceae bacterium StTr2]